jgi:hypothetical protein
MNLLILLGLVSWLGWIVEDSRVLSAVKDFLWNSPYFGHYLVRDGSLGGDIHEMRALQLQPTNEVLH